jgi:hypothetical protein
LAAFLWVYDHLTKTPSSGVVEVVEGTIHPFVTAHPTADLPVDMVVDSTVGVARTWLVGYGSGVYLVRSRAIGELFFYPGDGSSTIDLTPLVRAHYTDRFNEVSVDAQRRLLYVGAINTPSIGVFHIASAGASLTYVRTVRLPTGVALRWRIQHGSDGWLGIGYLTDALVYSLKENASGDLTVVRKLGDTLYPEIQAPLVAGEISASRVVMAPNGKRLAQAFLYSSRIHIYSPDGTLQRMVAGPVDVRLNIKRLYDHRDNQEKPSPTAETRFAYLDVAADNDRIIALFSGRRQGSYEAAAAASGDELHVFSWAGELTVVVRLTQDAMAIAIAPDSGLLWVRSADGRLLRLKRLRAC